MQDDKFQELFVARKACLTYCLTETAENSVGWVGGNAPAWFDDKRETAPAPDGGYSFFMAFENPLNGRMLSVFLPGFSVYNSRGVYPDCAIRVFEHEPTPESALRLYELHEEEPQEKKTRYQKDFDYSKPAIRKTYIAAGGNGAPFLRIGGEPELIQDEPCYYDKLHKDGYSFFCSADEEGYLKNDMIHGNMPFCYGALYLYAKFDGAREIVAGFWQNS